jgi:hypothetical protein
LTFVFYLGGAITFSICKMASREGVASMTNEYDISLATPDDVSGIIALQEPNLPANGGTLSVRQPADWFTKAILEKSLVVARRDGKVVGTHTDHSGHAKRLSRTVGMLSLRSRLCRRTAASYGRKRVWCGLAQIHTNNHLRGRPFFRIEKTYPFVPVSIVLCSRFLA